MALETCWNLLFSPTWKSNVRRRHLPDLFSVKKFLEEGFSILAGRILDWHCKSFSSREETQMSPAYRFCDLFQVLGTMLTYLIVLVQFKVTLPTSTLGSSKAWTWAIGGHLVTTKTPPGHLEGQRIATFCAITRIISRRFYHDHAVQCWDLASAFPLNFRIAIFAWILDIVLAIEKQHQNVVKIRL